MRLVPLHAQAILFIFGCLVGQHVRAGDSGAWVDCTPQPEIPVCTTCTQADLKAALQSCFPLVFSSYNWTDNQPPQIVYAVPQKLGFGVGNFLGQYFHVRGIAMLANGLFTTTTLFNISGIPMPRFLPGQLGNFSLVPTLQYTCGQCPTSKVQQWPHTCPGPWLYSDVVEVLRVTMKQFRAGMEHHPIVIQFRCSDTYYRFKYGMPGWPFYESVSPSATKRLLPSFLCVTGWVHGCPPPPPHVSCPTPCPSLGGVTWSTQKFLLRLAVF